MNDPHAAALSPRLYAIESGRPLSCGRDGVKKYRLSETESDRRNCYSRYGPWGKEVAALYDKWKNKWPDTDAR